MSAPLLSIQKLNPNKNLPFPGYFVVSTAPINVEDILADDPNDHPRQYLDEISEYLQDNRDNAEILIVIHGYNTSKGNVRNWFESIHQHIADHCSSRPDGLLLIGYRWPSEQIFPGDEDAKAEYGSFKHKIDLAKQALPVILGRISRWGTIGLIGGAIGVIASIVAVIVNSANTTAWLALFSTLITLSAVALVPILTVLAMRLAGYFRDNYRANNFGVSDLVELIRQLDKALVEASPAQSRAAQEADLQSNRIKLSFIGHSMGGFVVTNAVRILSDVFDPSSIGTIDATNPDKAPSRSIGNAFCLGRLVLASPDIPAETIISGRANFLQSSLRRFEEAYLFSNEGDMALRLASTAANYFNYPARTQDGGYRLGNVTVRNATESSRPDQMARKQALQEGATMRSESYGIMARLEDGQLVSLRDGQEIPAPGYPLDYLYIRERKPLSLRQKEVALAPDQQPIGERFSFFDCTDYTEILVDKKGRAKPVGIVSMAKRKQALSYNDYVALTIDYFTGKVDTHGGYFSDGETNPKKGLKPEAVFTKFAIYGLACLGFEKWLLELPNAPWFSQYEPLFQQFLADLASNTDFTADQKRKLALNQVLSRICRDRGLQVLLAEERHAQDILGID